MIDAHVHLFPDAATGRAWQEAVGFEAVRPGTTEDLLPRMKAAGIRRAVVLLFPRSAQLAQRLREEEPALDAAAIRQPPGGEHPDPEPMGHCSRGSR